MSTSQAVFTGSALPESRGPGGRFHGLVLSGIQTYNLVLSLEGESFHRWTAWRLRALHPGKIWMLKLFNILRVAIVDNTMQEFKKFFRQQLDVSV